MIELRFQQFHEQECFELNYELYVMNNGLGEVLYVGISTRDIWERWFGWGGHMTWDGDVIYGESPVGVRIEDHLPESLNWIIQLWTLEDCLKFCIQDLPSDTSGITIHDLEPILIRKLSPAINVIFNLKPGRDTMPKSEREKKREEYTDKMYDEIFNRKSPN